MEAQDKKLIWEDCPACAYKHLTAAYAIMTAPLGAVTCRPSEAEVFLARAVIALAEAGAGYEGNRDLAAGCLAAAESYPQDQLFAWKLRDLRLRLADPACDLAEIGGVMREKLFNPAAMAWAHITEAARELRRLIDREQDVDSDGEILLFSDPKDWLRQSILWVKETYELGGRDEAKA